MKGAAPAAAGQARVTAGDRRRSGWGKIIAAVAALSLLSRGGYGHAQLLNPPSSVGQVLEEYRIALESKDLEQLAGLYVAFSGRQRQALHAYLENAAGLTVELADVTVAPLGDAVAVTYTRRDHFIDRESGKPQHLEVRLTKILVPDDGGWKITDGL
ncbi:MAG TPA: nuclear transport factor 2 family protein [Candidatus Margulisiibacteriota bacterium]|nr:nuclear transport factor 2 family protein [Candidatus Margulisiibacteriota bacterium]